MVENNGLNGAPVKYEGETIFVALPPALWEKSAFGCGCVCGKCDNVGAYDTLAIRKAAKHGDMDRTWLVHYPELHTGEPARYRKLAGVSETYGRKLADGTRSKE